MTTPPPRLHDAFAALRARLGIGTVFPRGVLGEAELVARERDLYALAVSQRTSRFTVR